MNLLTDLIIYSKLYPPKINDSLVFREELYNTLTLGLTKKLTYISAPAGFGKTTLLADWVIKSSKTVAWITLSEQDNDLKSFFRYLIVSIQQNINPNFGSFAIKETESNYFDIDKCITLLINDFIFYPNDYLIVIDNYHLISEIKIIESISFIIKNIPNNVHFYISSKTKDQLINYSKLRAQSDLIEIGIEDLRFNSKYLKEFYRLKNINLSSQNLELIQKKTEGWILSAQLSSLFIKNSNFYDELDNKFIIDYVFDEVLANTNPDILSFLIKSSVLTIFNYQLCNEINQISNSNEIINYLDKNNLFITPIDNKGEYYRFHNLFSEILLKKLKINYSADFEIDLRNKAYNWYFNNNFINEALNQSFLLNEEDKILRILNEIINSKPEISINEYVKYIDNISINKIINYPKLCFSYLQYLIYSFKLEKSHEIITLIESNDYIIDATLNTYILFSKAYKNFLEENIDKSFEYIKLCMNSNKDKKDLFMISNCYIALSSIYLRKSYFSESLVIMNKGLATYKKSPSLELETVSDMLFIFIALNKFSEAEEKCNYISEKIEKIRFSFNYEAIKTKNLLALINIYFYQNRDIEPLISKLLNFLDKNENLALLSYAYMSLSNIYVSLGKFTDAESMIKNIEILDNNDSIKTDLIFLRARLNLYNNKPEVAKNLLIDFEKDLKINLSPDLYLIIVHNYISLKEFDKAQEMIEYFFENHPEKESIYVIYHLIFKSVISYLNNEEQYINYILSALKLAQKSNLTRIFLDFSDSLNHIINKILSEFNKKNRNNISTVISNKYIDDILVLFYQRYKNNMIENNSTMLSLTKREIELIEMLEQRLTNNEISEKLFVSINTIKTHIKNIYKKLDVKNREEAILRYKALSQDNINTLSIT